MNCALKTSLASRLFLTLTLLFAGMNASGYSGPLIDGHAHWGNGFNTKAVLDRYRSSGVIAQLVMPRYLGVREDPPTTDETVLSIALENPKQMYVLAGMQRPDFTFMNWDSPNSAAQRILSEIDQKLAERKVVGIGEVLVRHWAYAGDGGQIGKHAEINKSFDSVFIRQVAAVALQHDVPIVIHMEGYPDLVNQLKQVLNELPRLKLVWAHGCGRLEPAKIGELLEKHPFLHCDLSNMTNTGGYGSGWPKAEPFTSKMEEDGVFIEAYKKLILNFPDRFYVGMDVAHQSRWVMQQGNTFERRVQRTRELLGQLPTEVAKKLAFENVIRLFNLR
jgi:Tat protein secretion system quality control protein TatD with DNase activity